MAILALDLSKSNTGWAVWAPGWETARYGSWNLGSEFTSNGQVFCKLHQVLTELWQLMQFEDIYFEQAINTQFQGKGAPTSLHSIMLSTGLVSHVESFGHALRCRTTAINVATWRKDFVGSDLVKQTNAEARARRRAGGKGSSSDQLKSLVMERCRQLGFQPRKHDESDALGILDYALGFHEQITPPWRANEVLRPMLGGAV